MYVIGWTRSDLGGTVSHVLQRGRAPDVPNAVPRALDAVTGGLRSGCRQKIPVHELRNLLLYDWPLFVEFFTTY